MKGELEGRVALVTAAAGAGIGRATAKCPAEEGATVAVTDLHERRTVETVEALRKEFGDRIVGHGLDVADFERADLVLERGWGSIVNVSGGWYMHA